MRALQGWVPGQELWLRCLWIALKLTILLLLVDSVGTTILYQNY